MLSAALEIDACSDNPCPASLITMDTTSWSELTDHKPRLDRAPNNAKQRFIQAINIATRAVASTATSRPERRSAAKKAYAALYHLTETEDEYRSGWRRRTSSAQAVSSLMRVWNASSSRS